MFIAIEGPDGVGKTSVVKRMADILEGDFGEDVVTTFAPGDGGNVAVETRRLMLEAGPDGDPIMQFHLSMAGHRDQWNRIIKPAILDGATILSDRYAMSIFAYQQASGLLWTQEYDWLVEGIHPPDLYVVLSGEPREKGENAFDTASDKYKARVHGYYEELVAEGEFLDTPVVGMYHNRASTDSTARQIISLMDEL